MSLYAYSFMIEIPTILVLGAGASVPFGFPTGQRLKDEICSPSFRSTQSGLLNNLGYGSNKIKNFVNTLKRSGRPSVDAFLEYRDEFADIGKAAISAVLLPRENTGQLFENWIKNRLEFQRRQEGNWYDLLFEVLCDGVPFNEVNKNRLSIITFNYDRSFEQYLFAALKNSYGKSKGECAEIVNNIPIIHVHGSLGNLPWQSAENSQEVVPYDSKITVNNVASSADSIKIVPEASTDTDEFIEARKLVLEAQHLLFLGFGYHPTNMRRLFPPDMGIKVPYIKGTSLGLGFDRKISVAQRIGALEEKFGRLIPKDVYAFLHDFISFNEPSRLPN